MKKKDLKEINKALELLLADVIAVVDAQAETIKVLEAKLTWEQLRQQ